MIKKLNTLVKCNSELGDIPSFEEERAEYLVYQNRMKLCYNDKMGISVAEVEECACLLTNVSAFVLYPWSCCHVLSTFVCMRVGACLYALL